MQGALLRLWGIWMHPVFRICTWRKQLLLLFPLGDYELNSLCVEEGWGGQEGWCRKKTTGMSGSLNWVLAQPPRASWLRGRSLPSLMTSLLVQTTYTSNVVFPPCASTPRICKVIFTKSTRRRNNIGSHYLEDSQAKSPKFPLKPHSHVGFSLLRGSG